MAINIAAEKRAYKVFVAAGMTPEGACALIGNLEAESDGFYTNRVEYLCLKRLKENGKIYTDKTYTEAIDSGKISCEEFLHPLPGKQYGYGYAQWTSPDRKSGLYTRAKQAGKSISDEDIQLSYILWELEVKYPAVMKALITATSIREASDVVLKKFEAPANTRESVCKARAERGQRFYNNYIKGGNSMTVKERIEKATTWMEDTAKDDRHGYCQDHRWGEDGDYDCSSAVYSAWEYAGIPVKTYSFDKYGCAYTGVMPAVFEHFGFENVISKVNIKTGAGMERGDILLNDKKHTAMYCGNGKEVEASINEKGTAHGGQPGDQTGREFLIRDYRNYPWTHVYRYKGGTTSSAGTSGSGKTYLSKGDAGDEVKTMQSMLIKCGYSCGAAGADGDFGSGTDKGLRAFQKANGLAVDGQYGPASKAKLEALYSQKTSNVKKTVDELAKEVIAGKWGTGDSRKSALEKAGYNYNAVQKKVNEILAGSSAKKSITEIAKEVIAGKWGNGDTRKKNLELAGYNYTEVQKKVNELLK